MYSPLAGGTLIIDAGAQTNCMVFSVFHKANRVSCIACENLGVFLIINNTGNTLILQFSVHPHAPWVQYLPLRLTMKHLIVGKVKNVCIRLSLPGVAYMLREQTAPISQVTHICVANPCISLTAQVGDQENSVTPIYQKNQISTLEILEWMSNFITHFMVDVIT